MQLQKNYQKRDTSPQSLLAKLHKLEEQGKLSNFNRALQKSLLEISQPAKKESI